MTMYISSFYRKIQNEFHQKEKPSRLVQSYEYFDKLKKPRADNQPSKRAQFSRPQHSSRQPVNHLHSSPYDRLEASSPAENLRTSQNYSNNNNNSNLMSVSIDRKNQSNILRRSMERPNRLSAANPRRISTGDTHRSRSQLRSDSETRKMSYSSSQTRKNSRKNSSVENQNGKLTSKRLQTIKSNKSTEGSKTKDSEENNAEMEELYRITYTSRKASTMLFTGTERLFKDFWSRTNMK
ncbi:unnamed protein product [Oikopleura dioica]|uniref:Uncharacterized protein n=1 Tax=Oikopleura dioica TaxID=34765 RepID=E4Y080_OIKDI|nr:unnamed protein product [Oikopleura dioica]